MFYIRYRYMPISAPRFYDIVSQILSFDIGYNIELRYRIFCLRYRIKQTTISYHPEMKKCRYRMFYIRYRSMPISNKPTISHVLGCYDIEESTISALKSYIDIVADIVALCFDIDCASILNDSGGPGSCRAADRDCRLQFGFVGTGL